MDLNAAADANQKKKKRDDSDEAQEVQDDSKRSCPSSSPSLTGSESTPLDEDFMGELGNHWVGEIWPNHEAQFRHVVSKIIGRRVLLHINSLSPSPSMQHEKGSGSRPLKFKLVFCNPIAPSMYCNNEIKAENGVQLKVAVCDLNNNIISTGPLSVPINFFLLDGKLKEIMNPREGKPSSLISSNDPQLHLQDGVGLVNGVFVTDNSSWTISKKFCLGIKITDENFLDDFGMIEQVISEPFEVLEEEIKGSAKPDSPSWEDEVWKLRGICENDAYHKLLSSYKINTVGDFWKACRGKGPIALKMDLGMPEEKWNEFFYHAMKCIDVHTFDDQTIEVNNELVENEAQTSYNPSNSKSLGH